MTAFDAPRTADDPSICPARLPHPERQEIRHRTAVCRKCRLLRCEAIDVECRCEWAQRPLHIERLARMAEADNFLPGFAQHCRRRRIGQAIAGYIAAVACAAAAAWVVSSIAVAVLLDEARLTAMGIVP